MKNKITEFMSGREPIPVSLLSREIANQGNIADTPQYETPK